MELPPELTRIPLSALDVLRSMGAGGISSGDADELANVAGMTDRGIGKAIRGLVTKGYLTADDNYIYYLTEKGTQAIGDIAAYDAAQGGDAGQSSQVAQVAQDLIAVAPDALAAQQSATVQLGLGGNIGVQSNSQLILRLSSVGGEVTPTEITVPLSPGQNPGAVSAQLTPDGQYNAVRVQVEAIQMIGESDIHPAGGVFFDVPVGQASGNLQAWYGSLKLQS